MKIIGHRGARGLALENTIESIKAALKLPIHAIEIDIRRTLDGELVVLHDHHTGHISKRTLLVQNSTLEELRMVALHNEEQIPTLEEVFKLVGDKKPIMLDIKSPDTVDEMVRLLRKYPQIKALTSGRQYGDLKKIHDAMPRVPFLIQHHYDPMEVIHRANRMGAIGICINMWLMNPLTYRLAKQHGLEVYVYTIDHRWLLRFFERLYPDAVIISNHPGRLV
jgi:glycerophosphoryl diester phosphodiesterase